jgi:hypothetical protein
MSEEQGPLPPARPTLPAGGDHLARGLPSAHGYPGAAGADEGNVAAASADPSGHALLVPLLV